MSERSVCNLPLASRIIFRRYRSEGMKKDNNEGFSVVELIIVIAIMAVIIALLVPQFIKHMERSREAKDLQDIETYKTTVEAMVVDNVIPDEGIVIGINPDTNKIESNIPEADLIRYGIDRDPVLASKQWKAFEWHLDSGDYVWKLQGEDLSGAQYFTPLGKRKTTEDAS